MRGRRQGREEGVGRLCKGKDGRVIDGTQGGDLPITKVVIKALKDVIQKGD